MRFQLPVAYHLQTVKTILGQAMTLEEHQNPHLTKLSKFHWLLLSIVRSKSQLLASYHGIDKEYVGQLDCRIRDSMVVIWIAGMGYDYYD